MKEALKLALELKNSASAYWTEKEILIIEKLIDSLAQPEQEPVAVWELQEDGWDTICDGDWLETLPVGTKLYTTPPQREWVGLTDDEINQCYADSYRGVLLHESIEAKLKEKNT